ncbi:MAG: homoaconitate hydratase [Thermoprotei archaeon]|nr:MAG: homoaconitate hydratase [Thermoprotei archaeon]
MQPEVSISPYCSWVKSIGANPEIHDTTLREGEQTPGVVFDIADKVEIAGLLLEVGVDRIEAGFPASSSIEFNAIKKMVQEYGDEHIFGFARAVKRDVDAVIESGCGGLLLCFPPSEIHLEYKLRMSKEEYLERALFIVDYAKSHGLKIIYSAEDSTRASFDWLVRVFKTVKNAGVDVCRVVDTLGCISPSAMYMLISTLYGRGFHPLEVHCHNDHGLALANSLAAYEAGATGISTSVLGLGERAGITATEEAILALTNFYKVRKYRTELLTKLCRFVAEKARVGIWPIKPVVGSNVFTHYSGIHQDGVLKNPVVYECFAPEMVGGKRRILLGYVSGRAAVRAKLRELGVNLDDGLVEELTKKIKEYSYNRRSALTDEEFLELLKEVSGWSP